MGRTQGWAAGLRFAAMSLAHRADGEEAATELTGDAGTVAEYLLAEVLDAQPAGARELLLSTSIVDVLRPGLVEALAGAHAQRALSFLVHGNAFLEEIPESPGCYRYHPLFRELLRAQLAYESPTKVAELHRAAAEWLAAEGLLGDAVRHAVAAGAWEDAARYVVEDLAIGQLLVEHPPGRLWDAMATLPGEVEGACASLVRAAQALSVLDVDGCADHLAQARSLLGRASAGRRPAAQLSVSLLALVHAEAVADTQAALRAAAAAERLLRQQSPDRLAAHPELAALLASSKGAILLRGGHLDAATEAFTVGAQTEEQPSCAYPLANCLGQLALIAALRGQLRKAADLAGRAIAVQTRAGMTPDRCPSAAEVALAWVHTETCDLAAARRHAKRAVESPSMGQDPMPRAMLALVTARMHRARGDIDRALAVLAEAQLQEPALPVWLQDQLRVEEAALDIVNGDPALAELVVKELTEPEAPEGALMLVRARLARGDDVDIPVPVLGSRSAPLAARVGGWLLEASRQLGSGEERRAARALERSLQLAAPERLRRPFREAPSDVRRLLRRDGDLAVRHGWLGTGLVGDAQAIPRQRGTASGAGEPAPDRILEPLTEKEREVLGHLAELLTTDEIAGAMFVSVNTVRTHVRNILRKLAASRRNEAVRRARELRIITDS
ncbi:MAG: LuxR C-terminal-related transcriptional regulator [Actinomycetes bacterium]